MPPSEYEYWYSSERVERHRLDTVRLSPPVRPSEPPHAELLERPAASSPGSGWKRPPREYLRPANAFKLVNLQDAQAADPQVQNDFARPVYWTKLRLLHERALKKIVDAWCWFELVPEPGNPHDCDAVAVDLDGVRVGYVAADLANGLHGNIRYLNGDGRACYVPGVVLGGEAVYVALPTWATLERLVDRDLIAEELATLWEALPPSAHNSYVETGFEETRQTPSRPSR